MKRIALLVVAAAGLVACGDDDDSTEETTEAVATSTAATAATAPPATTGAPDTTAATTDAPATTEAVETTGQSVAPDGVMFTSPDGGFSVLLPGATASSQDQSLPDGTTVQLEAWQTPLGDAGAYTVARLALPEGAVIDTAALLQSAQDQALAGVGGTLTSEQPIDLNGIPGREFSATVSQGGVEGTIVQRVYLAGNTLYQINFAGEGDRRFTDPELAPFFESFTITGLRWHDSPTPTCPSPRRSSAATRGRSRR